MLTRDEELRLTRLARSGDGAAFDQVVKAHLPLVHAMAWEYRSHGVPLDDLVGEAMLGLVKGAREFDPERGVRLAGYAALWIHAYLRRFTLDNRRIVRGPNTRNARRVLAGLRRTERDLERRHGDRPEAQAVAQALGVSVAEVEEMRSVLSARDEPTGDAHEQHRELASHAATPERAAEDAERRELAAELVSDALGRLEPRMRGVLTRRCMEETPPTFAEIARELCLSRERVRQIEGQARHQLKAVVCAAMATRKIAAQDLWAA
jgi:RNA polymerase sigma factor (sigma-70 family)